MNCRFFICRRSIYVHGTERCQQAKRGRNQQSFQEVFLKLEKHIADSLTKKEKSRKIKDLRDLFNKTDKADLW